MSRTVDLRLDPERTNVVHLERSQLRRRTQATKQDRLLIPALGRNCVSWLREGEPIKVLVELADTGCLIVRPWTPYGEEVIAYLASLKTADGIDSHDRRLTVGVAVKLAPSTIESSGRLTFYEPFERHLGISEGTSPQLYVLCSVDRVEIWNEQYYTHIFPCLTEELKKSFPWSGSQY